jgi:hypothetical protein
VSDLWSPDESLGSEAYESWDEELDREDEVEPDRIDNPEGERALDRQLVVDQSELAELGVGLDDPERMAVLDGGIDDPDGIGPAGDGTRSEDDGWDLDAADGPAADSPDDDER